jgi:tetratricopeptide (TPR) repeat protein
VKKPQWLVIASAVILVATIFLFGRTVPNKKKNINRISNASPSDHDHSQLTIDTFLALARKDLTPEQIIRVNTLENSISRGDVKDQQISVYHQLARFWYDTANVFEPYAWYEAEAARLVNSEKSLTFAAHLFLENLQNDRVDERRHWKALQAKDLFERSLKINPDNDSSKVGLGACYLFGSISETPMEGILKIREVAQRDSTNIFAQMMLVQGSLISGQYDKAIARLHMVNRLQPSNAEAVFLLADMYDRTGDKTNAILWYRRSIPLVKRPEAVQEIKKRIDELSK